MSALNQLTIEQLTADYLKRTLLWGVPLLDNQGKDMPDTTVQFCINSAISQFEHITGIPLKQKIIKSEPVDDGLVLGTDYHEKIERLPFNRSITENYFCIQLPHCNISSVERVRGYLWDQALVFDSAAYRIAHPREGLIHILPTATILAAFAQFGYYPTNRYIGLPLFPQDHFPNFWSVDYTIGPQAGARNSGLIPSDQIQSGVYYLEDDIVEWILKKAAIEVLNIASTSNLPGIASKSLSFDGFSRSISTTASAMYALYSAQITRYDNDLKQINIERYRKKARGLRIYYG